MRGGRDTTSEGSGERVVTGGVGIAGEGRGDREGMRRVGGESDLVGEEEQVTWWERWGGAGWPFGHIPPEQPARPSLLLTPSPPGTDGGLEFSVGLRLL